MTECVTGWAVKRRDGVVIADFQRDVTEDKIWQIALGWPDAEGIAWEKSKGGRSFRCELREIGS